MANSIPKKGKKRKNNKIFTKLFLATLLSASAYFCYVSINELVAMATISKNVKEAQDMLVIIEEESKLLNNEKEKLEDPEYVKRFARSTYMLTKEGETIFILPAQDEEK